MTDSTTDDSRIDTLLRDGLGGARTDPRWDADGTSLTFSGIRSAARTRRRRARLGAAAGVAALVAGGALGLSALPDSGVPEELQYAAPPQSSAAPSAGARAVPGVRPPFRPDSGRDWLLTRAEHAAFLRTHVVPSPGPGAGAGPSPAPLQGASARLAADARTALPADARLDREDDLGGAPGVTGLHVRLADGTPVEVRREQLPAPVPYETWGGGDGDARVPAVADVPGTSSALVARAEVGYGWSGGRPGGARSVQVVDARGVLTTWYAPTSVPLGTVQSWAVRTAQAAEHR